MTLGQLLQRAIGAFESGRWADAERDCRAALVARPQTFEALYVLGMVASRTNRNGDAAALLAAALDVRPQHAQAHFHHAVVLAELGRPLEALSAYERALALDPRDSASHHNRGVLLFELKRQAEALHSFESALALNPAHVNAIVGHAMALWSLDHLDAALDGIGQALRLQPDSAANWSHRATILLDLDRPAEALQCCERALALSPATVEAHYNRGNALRALNRFDAAIASFDGAIALEPQHRSAHHNLADCLLITGRFERGWSEYGWRWRQPMPAGAAGGTQPAPWSGQAAELPGRSILLTSELGLGDTLQFCRYAQLIARQGATVVLEVQPPLRSLLTRLPGVTQVLAAGSPRPAVDLHCPLMRLPMICEPEPGRAPVALPYLRSDPVRVSALRSQLGRADRPRIGLMWSGSQGLRNDKRSMSLAQALPLLNPRAEWFGLHKELRGDDAETLAGQSGLRWLSDACSDFEGTAALVELMDLVVTVDTSIAHLAGGLGRPVWILLPHTPQDWRWFLDRADSPWYPTARLFRQSAPDDWAGVVGAVGTDLAHWLDGA